MSTIKNGVITVTPNKNGNIKLGNIWDYNTVYGNALVSATVNGITVETKGTCGGFCAECGCDKACYVAKSYRYPSVRYSHILNTLAIRNNPNKVYTDLFNAINRARNKPEYFRIHSSGEFETATEINLFNALAADFPQITFYGYTKTFSVIEPVIAMLSPNFVVNVSCWDEYGLDFYREYAPLQNVKAFVYHTGAYNHHGNGITFNGWCRAYNRNGKLNHAVTCGKCGLCMNKNIKVVGTFPH